MIVWLAYSYVHDLIFLPTVYICM